MTDAYAAGLTDGEGCLSLDRHFSPRVDLGMTKKALPVLRAMQATYEGKLAKRREATERWEEAWSWSVNSWPTVIAFLTRIAPHLILKAEQARLLLRAAEIREANPRRYSGKRADAVRWTPEAKARVLAIRKRIMELNRKGPAEETMEPGAIALLVGGEWVTPQLDLLSDLGFTPFSEDWPRSAIQRHGVIYELPTWARLTAATDGSASPALLPTPSAEESTPTDEFVEEMREHMDDPHERLYLPGRKWHAQRTLSRIVPPLLPTPSANDSTGAEGETRRARQEDGRTGGPSLRDLPKLLPTPTAGDGKSAGSRNLEGSKAHPGVSLTDAILYGDSETPRLLPTPQAADGTGGRQEKGSMRRGGVCPSGQKGTLTLGTAVELREELTERPFAAPRRDEPLLPTPIMTSSRNSRKAMVENAQWAAPHIEQALEIARGELPREFASWDEVPGRSGLGAPEGQVTLLPTPTMQGNSEPLNVVAAKLLPTPVANPDNPGAGGELRAALTHGETRRNETGTDSLGRPNRGRSSRLLQTPMSSDGEKGSRGQRFGTGSPTLSSAVNDPPSSGESTGPQSPAGSTPSAEPPPPQLTLEDG